MHRLLAPHLWPIGMVHGMHHPNTEKKPQLRLFLSFFILCNQSNIPFALRRDGVRRVTCFQGSQIVAGKSKHVGTVMPNRFILTIGIGVNEKRRTPA